ncbi:MAG: hypothetical protein J3K34DRAFT_518375 [Monoraphidium minutum]|nr:MAG: hypothetical protein J3K34DRAFT_518375 [Monoraphidium minutum]
MMITRGASAAAALLLMLVALPSAVAAWTCVDPMPPEAPLFITCTNSADGKKYNVTYMIGTYDQVATELVKTPWWGSNSDATDVSGAIAYQLGKPVANEYGPVVAYDKQQKVIARLYRLGEVDISPDPAFAYAILVPVQAGGTADPHMQGFNGAEYAFCDPAAGGAACQGHAMALLSERSHLLNARITRLAGPDAWPWAGTWMTAFGFRWSDKLLVQLEMATDVQYNVKPAGERGAGATRAVVRADWAGVFASAKVNGEDVVAKIGSGDTLAFGLGADAASVHFPEGRHPGDTTDGPVMVITTPGMQVTFYLETEDITHLDFAVALLPGKSAITAMHGLLGQSLGWARGAAAAVEGGDDMLYAVAGGDLLGAGFKYSLFGKAPAATTDAPRMRTVLAGAGAARALLLAGSSAALRLGA